jgi:hypothetical protein
MRYLFVITVALAGFFARSASAQTQSNVPQNVTVQVGDGDELGYPNRWVWVNKSQCDSNTSIKVRIGKTLLPTGTPITTLQKYEVWRGTSSCKTLTTRQVASGGVSTCTKVQDIQTQATTPTISATALEWFTNAKGDKTCTATSNQYITIIAAKGDTPPTGGTDNAIGAVDIIFTVDVTAYEAPTLTSAGGGESSLTIKYKDPAGFPTTGDDKTHVYFDFAGIGEKGADCESATFDKKAVPPSSNTDVEVKTGEPSKASIDPNSFNHPWPIDQQVPVAVAAVDAAGNISNLSNYECVVHENTTGFNDACQSDPKCKDQFDQCSASPWRRAAGLTSALVLMLCSLVFVRRKRRNV